MNDQQLALWLAAHGGEVGRKNNERQVQSRDDYGRVVGEPRTVIDSTTIEAADGATITLRRRQPAAGEMGPYDEESLGYEMVGQTPPDKTKTAAQRTPEQQRSDAAVAAKNELEASAAQLEADERSWNQRYGSGLPETHIERATREAKEAQEKRAEQQRQDERTRQQQLDRERVEQAQAALVSSEREGAANRALTQQQIDIQREEAQRRANQPTFLSQADTRTPSVARYDPVAGRIVYEANPNYDAVKAAAEERRAELASQIAGRQISLQEAQQQYTQWFDSNVRVPIMQSQEARARAEEQRQALEAEERRRQFAANYKLQKAELGQRAGQAAMQAEQSLLPYRSGPTWGADISSAINSLAAGGKIEGPDAGAGIQFSDSSFAFSRPDFKQIAKDAAKAALSGLTDYRPSEQSFSTADYSGIPAINTSGMPAYSYQPAALPAPSVGAELPPE